MKIGGSEFLLPSLAEMRMVDEEGGESLNRTEFSGCRQYTGESTPDFRRSLRPGSSGLKPSAGWTRPPGLNRSSATPQYR